MQIGAGPTMFLPGPGRLLTFTPEASDTPGTHTGLLLGLLAVSAEIVVEWASASATTNYRILKRRR